MNYDVEYFISLLPYLIFIFLLFKKKRKDNIVSYKRAFLFFTFQMLIVNYILTDLILFLKLNKNIELISQYFAFGISVLTGYIGIWNISKSIFVKFGEFIQRIHIKTFKNSKVYKTIEEVDSLGNNGLDFEEYVATLFKAMGYRAKTTTTLRKEGNLPTNIQNLPGSGEQGVDVIVDFFEAEDIDKDGNEYDGLLIQCKQYSNTVGIAAAQEIISAEKGYSSFYNKKYKLVLLTNNYITRSSKVLCHDNNVLVIERDDLVNLISKASGSVKDIKKVFA